MEGCQHWTRGEGERKEQPGGLSVSAKGDMAASRGVQPYLLLVKKGLCILLSVSQTGSSRYQVPGTLQDTELQTTCLAPTNLPGGLRLLLQMRKQARSRSGGLG